MVFLKEIPSVGKVGIFSGTTQVYECANSEQCVYMQ